jgi:hypothetical protein
MRITLRVRRDLLPFIALTMTPLDYLRCRSGGLADMTLPKAFQSACADCGFFIAPLWRTAVLLAAQ